MAHDIIMPMLGMAQDTGKLIAWRKLPGDAVTAGEVLFEVETDKSVSEVEAPGDGFLSHVQADEGADVPVGQVIAVITDSPEEGTTLPEVQSPEPVAAPVVTSEAPALSPIDQPEPGDRILASPKARRMAQEAGLDLTDLVTAGLPQPFHAADVADAVAKGGRPSAGIALHINARVPTTASDGFLHRLREEAGADLSYGNLALSFAARALRQATEAESLVLALQTPGEAPLVFTNPDHMRLSAMTGRNRDEAVDLTLLDLGEGYLTSLTVHPAGGAVLAMSRSGDALHLTLSYAPENLTTDQAILMMRDFTERMAQPMLALV